MDSIRETQQVRTTKWTIVGTLVVGIPFGARYAILGLWWMAATVALVAGVGFVSLYLIRARRWIDISSHLALLGLFGLLIASNVVSGGFYDPNMGWLYVIPVAAGLTLGRKAGVGYLIATVAVIVAFYLAPSYGLELVSQISPEEHGLQSLLNRVTAVAALGIAMLAFLSERDLSHQQMGALLASERQASAAKTAFLANISHEIRTPMNGVIGLTDMLILTRLNETQRKYTKTISQSANALLLLIDDLLDLAKIEAGHVSTTPEDFGLERLVEGVFDLLQPRAGENQVDMRFEPDTSMELELHADARLLRHVLINLLSNAIKFGANGPVTLSADTELRGEELWLTLQVTDAGIGVSEEQKAKIFQAFVQADSTTTRLFGGTGLGLAITRRHVEILGGTIDVESALGEGATFTVCVPVRLGATEDDPTTSFVLNGVADSRRRSTILVVDDIPSNRLVARAMLQGLGHDVVLAEGGRQALELLVTQEFDMVFMDCQMPDLDGYETTRRYRRTETDGDVRLPIVALTGHAMEGERHRCLAAGMDDHVSKPLRLARLVGVLETWLPAVDHGNVPGAAPTQTPDCMDGDVVADLIAVYGDLESLGTLVDEAMEILTRRTVDLQHAIDVGDRDEVLRHVHAMKGAVAQFGGRDASEACEAIYAAAHSGNSRLCEHLANQLPGQIQEIRSAWADLIAAKCKRRLLGYGHEHTEHPQAARVP